MRENAAPFCEETKVIRFLFQTEQESVFHKKRPSVFSVAQDGRAGRVQMHTSDRWWCCRVTTTSRNREPTVSAQPFYLHRIHLGIFCVFLLLTNPMKVPDLHWIFLQRSTVCLQLILLCHREPQCCTESHPLLPWLPHTYPLTPSCCHKYSLEHQMNLPQP